MGPFQGESTRTSSNCAYSFERHYYTSNQLFEQSLDIYRPQQQQHERGSPTPLVVLVVGSAWLGHQPIIYIGTNWWNSSLSKTIAKLGYTCVCIRHRGSFPRFKGIEIIGAVIAVITALLSPVYSNGGSSWQTTVTTLLTLLMVWLALVLASRGAAKFDDMVDDVALALQWIQQYRAKEQEGARRPRMIFGGYSSGAHVAATLLAQPVERWTSRGLPPPTDFIDTILLVSGVLATQSRPLDPPFKNIQFEWFTTWIVRVVFGTAAPGEMPPSPLYLTKPRLPHVLIACQQELIFEGLKPLGEILFCSEFYANSLHSSQTPARLLLLPRVNHWTILNSPEFKATVGTELERIIADTATTTNAKPKVCAQMAGLLQSSKMGN